MSICQIQFAVDDEQTADSVIFALLARRLIACGQRLGPIVSRYWWKGQPEEADEWLVLLKTREELSRAVIGLITEMHPYETPEIIVLAVSGGNAAYLQWVEGAVTPPRAE